MTLHANHIYQGDCIQKLTEIRPGSVDLVFADPPFNIGYEYDVYDDHRSRDEYLKWSRTWISGVRKALSQTGTFWLAIGDEYAAQLKVIAEDDIGFHCRSWVVWYYTFGVNCVQGFSRSHTHLFHFVKDPSCFTFNRDNPAVRVLSARQLVYADNRANSKGRLPDNTWILRPQDAPPHGFDAMHDTWYFARVAGTFKEREGFHGCQMPEQLLGRIIRVSSHPSDLVVDPFAGSGTTLAVAKKLGRQWLGLELSEDYVANINARLNSCRVGDPLDGPANPLQSAPSTARGKRKLRLRNGRPVPRLDKDTEKQIIDAYVHTSQGQSTDVILCDPELNRIFINACKDKAIPGDASTWNRLLLRTRKSGKLPKTQRTGKRLKNSAMDPYLAASEIAMHLLSLDTGLSIDEIFCSPVLATQFDQFAAQYAPGFSPFQYRWSALSIRKRARNAKTLALNHFPDWLHRRLPRAVPLTERTSTKYAKPGIYIVSNQQQTLYVGETLNVSKRVEQMLSNESWLDLEPQTIKCIMTDEPARQHGLQSILIQRTNPLFNSSLLLPESCTATQAPVGSGVA